MTTPADASRGMAALQTDTDDSPLSVSTGRARGAERAEGTRGTHGASARGRCADLGSTAGVSLRASVHDSVSEYFRTLDGEPCEGLYKLALGQFEQPLFEVVLREAGGNLTRAATILGMSRATLRTRLEKYGLDSG